MKKKYNILGYLFLQLAFIRKTLALCMVTFFLLAKVAGQDNTAARYEIEAKRLGVDMLGKDALPRSREFIRLDSTYYVGYMYEGMYKSDRSSDFNGYNNAISPLRKAFILLDKDYGKSLKGMFVSPEAYMANVIRYRDFLIIADALRQCYDNVERPDSVMWVLNLIGGFGFPKDHLGVNTLKAWTYHRNRFFTSEKYAFLKNSVEENEKLAFSFCYDALHKININKATNDLWFGPAQAITDRLNVYHYLALLHNYNKNYDSSEYYYGIMAENNTVSWNNFGSLKHELVELSVAKDYYTRDKYKYGQKMLREPFYFLPMLSIYAGNTKNALATCKEAIENGGSTPGFGWYNIALARSFLYDGQLDSAAWALQKAADFKEIHIGTTLTQNQYEFSIHLLKLQLLDRKISLVKFQNRGWWYSIKDWYQLAVHKVQQIIEEYILVNQLISNPERDRTVYELFCGESTTSWDEAFYLLKNFSPAYFSNKYGSYLKTDKRKNIQRYFQLFQHQMEWQNGQEEQANEGYGYMIKSLALDTANEKLFMARLFEGLARVSNHKDAPPNQHYYTYELYEQFPQLLPFSDLRATVQLTTTGISNEDTKTVIKELKNCNIDWTNEHSGNILKASIDFRKKGSTYETGIMVTDAAGNKTFINDILLFKKSEGAGKEIAKRFFGIGGAKFFEKS